MRDVERVGAYLHDLTENQQATRRAALDAGYFDQPRTGSLEDLTDEFDVTEAAISGRLRRAQKALFETVLK